MAKKIINKPVIEEVVTPIEETIEEAAPEVEIPEVEIIPEVVQEIVLDEVLKSNWKELLVSSLAKVDATHLEKNAILPLINGLIK